MGDTLDLSTPTVVLCGSCKTPIDTTVEEVESTEDIVCPSCGEVTRNPEFED